MLLGKTILILPCICMTIDTFSWYVPQFMLMSVTYWLWITYAKYPLPMICSVHKHCPPFTERTSTRTLLLTSIAPNRPCNCPSNAALSTVLWIEYIVGRGLRSLSALLSKLHNSRVWRGATIQNNYIFCCCVCCCGATLLLLGQLISCIVVLVVALSHSQWMVVGWSDKH